MAQMGNIEFLILAIGSVVFFTLLLVTGNTMAIAVRERTNELAVLKAVGYSDRFVLGLVLAESLLIAGIGGAIGLWFARGMVQQDVTGGLLPMYLSGSALATGAAVTLVDRPARRRAARHQRHAPERRGRASEDLTMPIPVAYNLRSARVRWSSSVVAVLGIAGTVGVFVAMLALARGFQATVTSSGLPQNAIVQRSGADSEMTSILMASDIRIAEEAPQVARDESGPLVSPEVVVIAALPMKGTDSDANVQIRGVSPRVLDVRDNVKMVEGRFLTPGLAEAVVGKGARSAYVGLELGSTVRIGAGNWTIVGVFDGKGTAFDSEVWADAAILNGLYQRPPNVYQSATVRLKSPEDLPAFRAALESDPRLNLQAVRETDYYAKQSEVVTKLITVLGTLVAVVMGLGAVFGALNTMYSAVSERSREIAVLRAIGFGGGAIVLSFFVESLLIAAGRRGRRLRGGAAGERPHHGHHQLADLLAPRLRLPDHARPARDRHGLRADHGRRRRPAARDPRGTGERGHDAAGAVAVDRRSCRWPSVLCERAANAFGTATRVPCGSQGGGLAPAAMFRGTPPLGLPAGGSPDGPPGPGKSLPPQRVHRLEAGGVPGRIEAEADPDRERDQERHEQHQRVHGRRPAREALDQERADEPERAADDASGRSSAASSRPGTARRRRACAPRGRGGSRPRGCARRRSPA